MTAPASRYLLLPYSAWTAFEYSSYSHFPTLPHCPPAAWLFFRHTEHTASDCLSGATPTAPPAPSPHSHFCTSVNAERPSAHLLSLTSPHTLFPYCFIIALTTDILQTFYLCVYNSSPHEKCKLPASTISLDHWLLEQCLTTASS